jgi:hypothetical protein
MPSRIALYDYRTILEQLPFLDHCALCCNSPLPESLHIEPLEGRRITEVERTCIVRCKNCGMKFGSLWD